MKRSGLIKGLALLLAIISLSTLVSGLFGMRSAAKDRQKNEAELADLQNGIDDYRNLIAQMLDSDDYDQLRAALEKQQRNYDRTTTRHRKELAAFTATNGGLEMGAQSLAQAEAAMASGRTQLEAGKQQLQLQAAAFQTVYETAMAGKKQLEDSLPILDAAETMVSSLRTLLQSLQKIGVIMELPEGQDEPKGTEQDDPNTTEENEESDINSETGAPGDPVEPETDTSTVDPQVEDGPQNESVDGKEEDIQKSDLSEENGNESPEASANVEEGCQDGDLSEESGKENPEEAGNYEEEDSRDSNHPEETDREDPQETGGAEENQQEKNLTEDADEDGAKADAAGNAQTEITEEEKSEPAEEKTGPESEPIEEKPTSPKTGTEDNQEAMRLSALEAYDAALSTYQDALTVIETLQDREIPTSIIKEMLKKEGITKPEELKALAEQAGLELTEEQEQTFEDLLTQESIVLFTSVQIAELKAELEKAAGMPLDELMAKMQSERDAIAAGEGEYELNAEQFGTIRKAYTDNRESILGIANALEKELPALEAALVSGKSQITAAEKALKQVEDAKKTMDQGLSALNSAEGSLYQGELMLAQGEAQLEDARKKQYEKAEELETEKRSLDEKEKALLLLSEEAEARKKLEEKEKSLRQALLSREQIRQRSDAGEELLGASESWYSELAEQTAQNYRMWFIASILLILSGILALAVALTVLSAGIGTLIPVLISFLCTVCAAGALILLFRLGRGISYSGLLAGGLAGFELILLAWETFKKTSQSTE